MGRRKRKQTAKYSKQRDIMDKNKLKRKEKHELKHPKDKQDSEIQKATEKKRRKQLEKYD